MQLARLALQSHINNVTGGVRCQGSVTARHIAGFNISCSARGVIQGDDPSLLTTSIKRLFLMCRSPRAAEPTPPPSPYHLLLFVIRAVIS